MDFNNDWLTLGRHRVRLSSTKGFPTETMRTAVDVIRLAIDSNMSARARLVEVALRRAFVSSGCAVIGLAGPSQHLGALLNIGEEKQYALVDLQIGSPQQDVAEFAIRASAL